MVQKKLSGQKSPKRSKASSKGKWAVIWIDEAPIREGILRHHQQLEKKLEAKKAVLEQFRTCELHAYAQWEAKTFGAQMTEFRDLENQYQEKSHLLFLVDEEASFSGCSRREAYRRVMERKNNPLAEEAYQRRKASPEYEPGEDDLPHPDEQDDDGLPRLFGESDLPPDFDIRAYDQLSKAQKTKFAVEFGMMGKVYEAMTGMAAPDLEELLAKERERVGGAYDRHQSDHYSAASPAHESQLKSVYRSLARRLHPDSNKNLTERELEIWHQVQEAYQRQDVEKLEMLLAQCESGAFSSVENMSVGLLVRLIEECKEAVDRLQSEINRMRKHPAWGFLKNVNKREKIKRERQRYLQRELADLRFEKFKIEEELAFLAIPPPGKKSRPEQAQKPVAPKPPKGPKIRPKSVPFEDLTQPDLF